MSRLIGLFVSYLRAKYFNAFIQPNTLTTIWTSVIRFPVATEVLHFTILLYILRDTEKPTELTEETLPVHNKSKI